jgi:hypothetical protein
LLRRRNKNKAHHNGLLNHERKGSKAEAGEKDEDAQAGRERIN